MSDERRAVYYPVCGDWSCDDEEDWEWANADYESPEFMAAVKREHRIVYYHQPRDKWRDRLWEIRKERNRGEALWAGK